MKLWVLCYRIDDLEIFLTPENAHSSHVKDALKFQEKDAALTYLDSFKSFLSFEPHEIEFEFKE